MWNQLVEIKNDRSYSYDIRSYAQALLNQINTAGGIEKMKQEAEAFILDYNSKKEL